ncbi:MAG: hypothetical protein RLY16_2013, partial [Bacteroidota bacterium]
MLFSFDYYFIKQNAMATQNFDQLLLNNTEFLKPFAITLTRDQEVAKDL